MSVNEYKVCGFVIQYAIDCSQIACNIDTAIPLVFAFERMVVEERIVRISFKKEQARIAFLSLID